MMVRFDDEFAIAAAVTFAVKLGQRADGIMRRRVRQINEEWFLSFR